MRVAIIGAGISGLSCAIELEKHGVRPVIFEKRAHVGEALLYSIIWPRVINRPLQDPLRYLKREYSLELTPVNPIKKIVMFSPGCNATERGNLGYIFRRGFQDHSLEYQLLERVSSPITFNRVVEADDIKDDFDYILVANSSNNTAIQLGLWTDTFNAKVRIATVLDKFNPREVIMWMNTNYAKNGFCYLVANSEKEASLVLIINNVTNNEFEYYWRRFLFTENISYYISHTTDAEHDCGFVQPLRTGNILFSGNAAGFTDDLIGCGSFNAVESGILAARAMLFNKEYDTLAAPIFNDIVQLHELRKAYNTLDNNEIDHIVNAASLPIIKNAIYNNPFFRMSDMAGIIKLYNNSVKRKRHAVK